MPRTFQATIALIVTLNVLVILTVINLWQTNTAEKNVIDLRQKVDALNQTTTKIERQLERGVAVAGGSSASGASHAGGDRYAAALNEPDNILAKATDQLIAPDAVPGGTLRRIIGDDPKGISGRTSYLRV